MLCNVNKLSFIVILKILACVPINNMEILWKQSMLGASSVSESGCKMTEVKRTALVKKVFRRDEISAATVIMSLSISDMQKEALYESEGLREEHEV